MRPQCGPVQSSDLRGVAGSYPCRMVQFDLCGPTYCYEANQPAHRAISMTTRTSTLIQKALAIAATSAVARDTFKVHPATSDRSFRTSSSAPISATSPPAGPRKNPQRSSSPLTWSGPRPPSIAIPARSIVPRTDLQRRGGCRLEVVGDLEPGVGVAAFTQTSGLPSRKATSASDTSR